MEALNWKIMQSLPEFSHHFTPEKLLQFAATPANTAQEFCADLKNELKIQILYSGSPLHQHFIKQNTTDPDEMANRMILMWHNYLKKYAEEMFEDMLNILKKNSNYNQTV